MKNSAKLLCAALAVVLVALCFVGSIPGAKVLLMTNIKHIA